VDASALFKHRIQLHDDDVSLNGRLKILKYLVKEKKCLPPNPLDAVRFRQCGILRWMVDESMLNLKAKAFENKCKCLVKVDKELQFLNGQRIPSHLSVGELLCFAAIEFDDMQSLEWLIVGNEISIEFLTIYGWNLLHASAYFGRSEIIIFLSAHKDWMLLVTQLCTRMPWVNAYAAHIAIEKGNINAASHLLFFNCPPIDANGKSIEKYAIQSKHKFVQVWSKDEYTTHRCTRKYAKTSA